MKQLEQRVAVVTGAGSGIGRAVSLLLAKRGCRVALADVSQEGLDETQRQIAALGTTSSIHHVDVSNRERMARFADEIVEQYGAVHILINNAGVAVNGRFEDTSLADFEWLMGINFWGVVHGCKFFLPHLMAADEAHIVNMSSLFGLIGVPQQTAYCASKFAVRGFSESLRAELVGTRVGLTSVHPGGVATSIASSSRVAGDDGIRERHQKAVERFKRMMPPEEAAAQIVRGIERKRSRLLITRETHILDLAKRVAPTGANSIIDWGWKLLQ